MSDFEIDFEWPVAPKYEFRPATSEEPHYSTLVVHGLPKTDWPFYFGRIVRVGGKPTKHRPTSEKMRLAVKALVEDEYRDAPFHLVALKIVRALGTLSPRGGDDGVLDWYRLARSLRQMFEPEADERRPLETGPKRALWPPPRWSLPRGHLGIYLMPGKGGKPILALRPDDLSNALKLYAARMIATGTTFNVCENCKTPFLSGGSRGRSKRRGDARFCSDECRWKFHNESRRKAR